MNYSERYNEAKEIYRSVGVDTDAAIEKLKQIKISLHCWQGDDVNGFDNDGPLTGGISVTGNYPGKARTPEELMADIDKALSLIPGKHKINLHASYAIGEPGEVIERDSVKPAHFKKWVEFAKQRGLGLDFNPTFFSHPMVKDNLTLSSPDEDVRKYWVRHGQACIRIADYFASELNSPCLMNIWIPDGYKDIPADRFSPRARFKKSLDEILETPYDKEKVIISLESKVWGMGLESYTVGSAEFVMGYAAHSDVIPLLDNGHYHPTETVSDKIPTMLLFYDRAALHVTRPVRWDSDHVVRLDDETKEIAKELVRCDALERVPIGLDFFDGSINRIAAWVIGTRNFQKALLEALLAPHEKMAAMQRENDFTRLMMLQEELKTYPIGAVWDFFCAENGVPVREEWYDSVEEYEQTVLKNRR